ncbi:cysteine desulfurase family protein [Terriglobus aquaticus]|uniref:cysteine desulfurase n=1 Tax=Terriglobus aquaticus TaxID=940139 RepID=A0ABW9KHV9_9BACT|nr:cysteine desulfurase family protein [Terriglobus aquaticus]
MPRIYLDNNATTPVLPEVVVAMQPWWTERFGNASAVHSHGRDAREAVDHAREQVAALIGARANEITFTGSGTEADNQAIFGTLAAGDHLMTSSIEHHAVLHAAHEAERRGAEVTIVDPDRDGVVQVDAIRAALRHNTKLISLMLANNETGVLQPVQELAALARERGILVHTDAVQCGGKLPIRVRDLGCDLLSLSAHKMHAPQGVGALWVRRGLQIRPLLFGGPHERQRRAGTENVPGIVGFGEAASLASAWLTTEGAELEHKRRQFESELLRRVAGATIHGVEVARLPNTTSVRFDGVDAEALVIAMDLRGVSISGGSACTSGAVEPSHVLRAMGLSDAEARSTVRISMSRLTTWDELEAALTALVETVERLRSIG